MGTADFLALLFRFVGDILTLILLYDFFVQPFRFYGMDPLTRFVWMAARKICAPFEAVSRKIIRLPDRDLTPLFTLVMVVVIRGLLYGVCAGPSHPIILFIGMTLSFQELFTRLLVPGLLFVLYADIQLSRHQETFVGNVLAMLVHDVAKRFIVTIRRLLPSYRPLHVFITAFVLLGLFEWLFLVVTLLPFGKSSSFNAFSPDLIPEALYWLDSSVVVYLLVNVRLAQTFLFGIFILVLMNVLSGFSGLDPYDRFSIMLGLVISPWLVLSRRLFRFARIGMFDFSIAILLFIPYFVLAILEALITRGGT